MAHFPWDIVILAVVALFLCGMLFRVLGRKVGKQGIQRENYRIMAHVEKIGRRKVGSKTTQPPPLPGSAQDQAEKTEYIVPKAETSLGQELIKVSAISANFQGDTFLKQTEEIFEKVIAAFSNDNPDFLKEVLTDPVFSVFSEAMKKRKKSEDSLFVDLKRVERLEITGVSFGQENSSETCLVSVAVTSWQVRYTKNVSGGIIEGTESLTEFKDEWGFFYDEGQWRVAKTAVA